MITKITGVLNRVLDEGVRLQVGALEYEVKSGANDVPIKLEKPKRGLGMSLLL